MNIQLTVRQKILPTVSKDFCSIRSNTRAMDGNVLRSLKPSRGKEGTAEAVALEKGASAAAVF